MISNLIFFLIALIALITIGFIYFLFSIKPKYSFTIPQTSLTNFSWYCSGDVAIDAGDAWRAEDYCTIVACHDNNYDEKSCSEIEPLLKVAKDQTSPTPQFGLTISSFESALKVLELQLAAY